MNNINIKNIFSNNTLQNNPKTNICVGDFSVNTIVESNTFNSTISDDYIIDKISINNYNFILIIIVIQPMVVLLLRFSLAFYSHAF